MIVKDLFLFLTRDPNQIQIKKIGLKQRILLVAKVLCLIYTIKLLFAALQIILVKLNILDEIKAVDSANDALSESGSILFLLQFAFFGPILEELGFRAILQKGALLTAAGFASMILLLSILCFDIPIYAITWSSVLSVGMACVFFCLLINAPWLLYKIMQIRNKYAWAILWVNAIAFAFWHFYNFDFAESNIVHIVWYLTPHFMVALILSWLSLKAGFLTACAVHVCNNLLPALFVLYANRF